MGIEKAHVMGTSYGGTIAMMTAIHFPERVQSLVLAATTPSFAMAEPIVSQATAGRDASAIENFSLQHMIKPGAADSDVRTAETRAAIRTGPPAAVERRMDRKSVVEGKRVSGGVDLGGCGLSIQKQRESIYMV